MHSDSADADDNTRYRPEQRPGHQGIGVLGVRSVGGIAIGGLRDLTRGANMAPRRHDEPHYSAEEFSEDGAQDETGTGAGGAQTAASGHGHRCMTPGPVSPQRSMRSTNAPAAFVRVSSSRAMLAER